MTQRRQSTLIISIVILLGLSLGCASLLLLPDLIETWILPRIASQAGLSSLECRINHLGLTKTSAGPLTLGAKSDPAITIERITLSYNPSSIQKKELEKIMLSGVSIKTVFRKGTITIPGLEEIITKNSQNGAGGNKISENSAANSSFPVPPFAELQIERSVIIYEFGNKMYRIPFSLKLKKSASFKPEAPNLHGTLEIRPRNTPITLKITTTFDKKAKLHLSLQANAVDLLNFADILQTVPTLELKGQLVFNANAELKLSPLKLETLAAKLFWYDGLLAYNNFHISSAQNPKSSSNLKSENDTLVLTLQKNGPDAAWQLTINQLFFDSPFNPAISDIYISAETNSENIKFKGNFITCLNDHLETFRWTKPLLKKWNFAAKVNSQGNWQTTLESPADKAPWEIQKRGLTISGDSPTIAVNASGFRGKGEIECLATIKKPIIKSADNRVTCPAIKADVKIKLEPADAGFKVAASTLLDLAKSHLHNKEQNIDLKLPELLLRGEFHQSDSSDRTLNVNLQFTNGNFQAPNYDFQVQGITGILPWSWPVNGQISKQKGKLDCQKIFFKEFELGQFSTSLQQQGEKIYLNGRYKSTLFDKLEIITEVKCGLNLNGIPQASGTFNLPPYKPKTPIDLGDFSKSANGNVLDGSFSARGALSFDARGINGSATVVVKDTLFRNHEKNLLCNGINCRLHFPELPSLRSAPNQTLIFDQFSVGNIICMDGNLSFQIESDTTLLLEKIRISWCDGNIETQALRISSEVDHYQSTLYCDRLQLAKLLEQLGQIEAQGQGSLNGRIPISWENGKITFDDGFLYSTPGQGGTIKIADDKTITAGLPTSSPQFAQLDLAREALKDYQYKWTKMKLNSEDKELILNLQFDGKPNAPLPFVYKKELAGFVRVSEKSPGSHFQGINLDINLRLPLNRILQYKDLSTMLE